MAETEVDDAARRFPTGLEQPEGSFRFSADALALAHAAAGLALPGEALVCDLGTGCGVAAFAVLLQKHGWKAVGLEREAELAAAAERNALRLGLAERFAVVHGDAACAADLRRVRERLDSLCKGLPEGGPPLFDAVICNPPWKKPGQGRMPPERLRRRALFGTDDTFSIFFSAADQLLKARGVLVAVSGAERTADMLSSLPPRLHPEALVFCLPGQKREAEWVILLARKNGRALLKVKTQAV